MGKIHRERGYREISYYLPSRLWGLWWRVRQKGYSTRDIIFSGLLAAEFLGGPRSLILRIGGRRFTIRTPDGIAQALIKKESHEGGLNGQAGAGRSSGVGGQDR